MTEMEHIPERRNMAEFCPHPQGQQADFRRETLIIVKNNFRGSIYIRLGVVAC